LFEFTVNDENLDKQKEKVLSQIEENKQAINKLLNIKEKTYDNFVKPYQLLHEKLNWYFKPIAHLNYVKNTEKTQKVYSELLPVLTTYYTELGQNEKLYYAFKEIYEREKEKLSVERKKVLEDLLLDFELSGISLPEEKKKRRKRWKNVL